MVSVIVLNYNGELFIGDCLSALAMQTFTDFELIVVDNASRDASLSGIHEWLQNNAIRSPASVVALGENLGFSGGNIEGLKRASGEFIALLNNDTEVYDNWLEELFEVMREDPKIGICASKLVSYGEGTVDSAGDGYTRLLKAFKRGEGESPEKFDKKEPVFGACAGAALYRRSMLDEIGFLDDDFFLIHEDTDLNFRAKLAGWKCMFVPTAVVRHKVTSSIGYMSDMQVYHTLRNSELVRMKDVPFTVYLLCLPEFVLGFISEFIYFGIKHRRMGVFIKAKKDALKLFPRMLRKRRAIMALKKISNRALMREMTPLWDVEFLKKKVKRMLFG